MPTVLEEITEIEITPTHIRARIDDWRHRIEELYNAISSWLPLGYSADRLLTVTMNEELMKEFLVEPRLLPVLTIRRDTMEVAEIRPRALWVIGANGRLDMLVGESLLMIVDRSEYFSPPSWFLVPFSDRKAARPLDKSTLAAALQK